MSRALKGWTGLVLNLAVCRQRSPFDSEQHSIRCITVVAQSPPPATAAAIALCFSTAEQQFAASACVCTLACVQSTSCVRAVWWFVSVPLLIDCHLFHSNALVSPQRSSSGVSFRLDDPSYSCKPSVCLSSSCARAASGRLSVSLQKTRETPSRCSSRFLQHPFFHNALRDRSCGCLSPRLV